MGNRKWMPAACSAVCIAACIVADAANAKEDGSYLHDVTLGYATPHPDWGEFPPEYRMKTLFITPRAAAREVVELVQRLPMDFAAVTLFGPLEIANGKNWYEGAVKGTSFQEKKRELLDKLESDFDLYVVAGLPFDKLPEEAQYRILSRVRDGAGLLLASPERVVRPPYGKLFAQRLDNPPGLDEIALNALPAAAGQKRKPQFAVFASGKGRAAILEYNGTRPPNGQALTPYMDYSRAWPSGFENAMAFLMRACLWTARGGADASLAWPELAADPEIPHTGKEFAAKTGSGERLPYRVRGEDNQVLFEAVAAEGVLALPALPSGRYCCDVRREEGGKTVNFGVFPFHVASPVGVFSVNAPEMVNDRAPFAGSLALERPPGKPLAVTLELVDSPYGRVWRRQALPWPAEAETLAWTLDPAACPTLAAYVRATLSTPDGLALARTEKAVFFPDYTVESYFQFAWGAARDGLGDLYARRLVDDLGWNAGLYHPAGGGENFRPNALLNQWNIPYMTRIALTRGPRGEASMRRWFFLPAEYKKEAEALAGDDCFYRPEVQKLWAAIVASRMPNMEKYGAAIYSLGDENMFDVDSGYGAFDEGYFREFLKKKYGGIAALNHNWRAEYADFDAVPHPTLSESRAAGNFAAWFDHRQYMEKMYADIHRFCAEEIKKHDPRARVGAEGSKPGDIEETIDGLDFWAPYYDPLDNEALRGFGGGRIRSNWWGGYVGSHGGRGDSPTPLLNGLLTGAFNASAWYTTGITNVSSALGVDYTPAAYFADYLPWVQAFRWGLGHLLANLPLADHGIRLYWSHPSNSARLLDPRLADPRQGFLPFFRHAYARGLNFDFVSARHPERLAGGKILFCFGLSSLSGREAEAIVDFVKSGGVAVADLNPGLLNENLRAWEKNPLAELFGDPRFDGAAAPDFAPLDVNGVLDGQAFALRAGKALQAPGGKPMEVRTAGKGKAILLNFTLGSAENSAAADAPLSAFLDAILSAAGVAPEYGVKNAPKDTIVRVRSGKGYDLLGVLAPRRLTDKTAPTVALSKPRFVYALGIGAGDAPGRRQELTPDFNGTDLRLYALFDGEQKPPAVKPVSETLDRGGVLRLDAASWPKGRVYTARLFDPAGRELTNRHRVLDVHGAGDALELPLAYNDPVGRWRVTVEDVATGLSGQAEFAVQ